MDMYSWCLYREHDDPGLFVFWIELLKFAILGLFWDEQIIVGIFQQQEQLVVFFFALKYFFCHFSALTRESEDVNCPAI